MRSVLLVLLVLSTTAPAAPVRFMADAVLIGGSGGGTTMRWNNEQYYRWNFDVQFVRVTAGAEFGKHVGVTVGATWAQAWFYQHSLLPVTARLWWDFDSDQRWRRRTAYAFATYHHTTFSSDDDPDSPYTQFGAGIAYTFYGITPKAELWVRPYARATWDASLMVGLDIGGTYVFGRRGARR